MRLERILQAAVNSMVHGHHAPHCYSAHVVGRGYVNDGSKVYDRADYLRQLERSAQSEVDNMGFAPDYAEPGYDTPAKGVLFANWNCLPENLDRILERAGYAVEWSDEWTMCEDCQRAFRTSADSFCWSPAGVYMEGSRDYSDPYQADSVSLCLDCLQEWAEGCRANERQDETDRQTDCIAGNLDVLQDRLNDYIDRREDTNV